MGLGRCKHSREARELRLSCVPDLDALDVLAHKLLEVRRHGAAVSLEPGAGRADALADVEDDAREAVFVDPGLLVVGDLAQLAAEGERTILSARFQQMRYLRVEGGQADTCEGDADRQTAQSDDGVLPDVGKLLGQVADYCASVEGGTCEFGHREEVEKRSQSVSRTAGQ